MRSAVVELPVALKSNFPKVPVMSPGMLNLYAWV